MLKSLYAFVTSATLVMAASAVAAQTTTIIVPSTAGGTQDRTARLLAETITEQTGKTIVVVNKPGAGGTVGSAEVANAAPDGLTLGLVYDSHATNHLLFDMPYDTFMSFTPVNLLMKAPMVMVSSTELPYQTMDDLLNKARENPGAVTYGSIGAASTTLAAARLADEADIEVTAVPYSGGGGPYAADLLAGRLDYVMASMPGAIRFFESGQLRPLGYGGPERTDLLPETPTFSELFPGMTAEAWVGIIAPAGLTPEKTQELYEMFDAALKDEATAVQFRKEGFVIESLPSEAFADKIRQDATDLEPLILSVKETMQ